LEQIKRDKEALEVKMGEEVGDEDLQRIGEFIGVISRHTKEIKKFEDWLSEKTTLPLKLEKVSDVSSVKLWCHGVSSSFFFFFWWKRNGLYWFSFFTFCWCWCGGDETSVVEEVKVNKQPLADANKLMADARFKGMKAVASLAGHTNEVRSVAFSPDGQHIVSGSWDNLVKVWSVSGAKEVASLAGHTNVVCSVAFSPDGQHIVSGSADNLVKVWSLSGGKEVASLAGHAGSVCSVAFSPDGQHIVSGSSDNLVKVWSVSGGKDVESRFRSWGRIVL
jgi:WD40 repeat protein